MAQQVNEGTFPSANGEYRIHYKISRDDSTKPFAILQLAHGMVEHIGCYQDFINALTAKGYIVAANDHVGHGKSINKEEDLGYFAEKDGDEVMLSDMHTLYEHVHEAFPALPYFLLGHSMGSFLAKLYVTRYPDELRGVIFCGTANYPALFGACGGLVKAVFRCSPLKRKWNTAYRIGLKLMNRPFRKEAELGNEFLSRRRENLLDHLEDPLCGYAYSYAGYRDLAVLVTKISGEKWASKVPPALPVLLISGEKDSVGKNGRAVYQTVQLLRANGSHPEAIIYPNDRHEILNEDDRETVFGDIDEWIRKTLEKNPENTRKKIAQ